MKTFDEILADLITNVVAKTPFTNLNVGAGLRGILEAVASGIAGLYQLIRTISSALFVQTAEGTWLDLKVREVGVRRLAAKKARVRLTFGRSAPATQDILIPAGTLVRSRRDAHGRSLRFATDTDVTLVTGQSSVVATATAEEAGTLGNVGPGTISLIVTTVSGIETVINQDVGELPHLMEEGADPESDRALRERAILKWDTIGVGGTRGAYLAWALAVPGVKAAMVLDDAPYGPGTVGLVILGADGVPTPQLLSDVAACVRPRQPLTAQLTVTGAMVAQIPLSLTIWRFATADVATVDTAIRIALAGFSDGLQLGEGLVRARLVAAVMAVDGVYNVTVDAPTADLPATPIEYLDIDASVATLVHRVKGRSYQEHGQAGGEAVPVVPAIDKTEWSF